MCGGIRFKYSETMQPMLSEVLSGEQLAQAQESGVVQSVYWQPRPVLPALVDDELKLFDWGNRDENLKLPKTGWVRAESLEAGKWDYLKPKEIVIPAFEGVEKKVWFTIDHGIRGLLVHRGDEHRVGQLGLLRLEIAAERPGGEPVVDGRPAGAEHLQRGGVREPAGDDVHLPRQQRRHIGADRDDLDAAFRPPVRSRRRSSMRC